MSGQVLAFPGGYNPRDIRGMAIEFAARLASEDYGEVKTAVIVFDSEQGLGMMSAGPCDGYRLIGLLETAKLSVIADAEDEE